MKRSIIVFIAILASTMAFCLTTPILRVSKKHNSIYYMFKFEAADNDASNINNWTTISEGQFEEINCSGTQRACTIVASAALNSVPVVVPYGQTYQNPIASGNVIQVHNRSSD